jgi:hypothetical protein
MITAKQLDNLIKKKKIDECYFIDIKQFNETNNLHNINQNTGNTIAVSITEDERINQQWCKEFKLKYPNVFKDDIEQLPPIRNTTQDMIIFKPDHVPISIAPYKMSPIELKELRRQLDILLQQGLIEPTASPYGSPVLFVKQKQGDSFKLRMVCDYRAVNKATISQGIPVPRIDECLEQLYGANFYSSLDLKSGFHQQRLTDSDSEKTTINTRYGQYKWKVIPFGLKNSGRQFMNMVNHELRELIDKICIVYIDDILIFTKGNDVNLHKKHVQMVLEKLEKANLIVNKDKCLFNQSRLTFLGYDIIAGQGILPSKKKVQAITEWLRPTNVQEVRKFIGLCQYYKQFIPGFSSIAASITDLTKGTGHKKRDIIWSTDCENAFKKLKQLVTTAPVLLMPDMSKNFRIECDASDIGLGAVLLQEEIKGNDIWKPVAYESRKLSKEERNYPAQERELLSILNALRIWRCFIDGNEYEVYTDHLPLKYYNDTSKISPRLVRWMSELSLYSPKIIYKQGTDNIIPDLLSRRDDPKCNPAELSIEPKYLYEVYQSATAVLSIENENELSDPTKDWPLFYFKPQDKWPKKWLSKLKSKQDDFMVKDGHVWKRLKNDEKTWVKFIPFKRRADLVEDFHRGFGHQGTTTVDHLMKSRFWWPQMNQDIKNWLTRCNECQLHARKEKNIHHAPMKPLEVPPPFARWHIDFIGILPTTEAENKWIIMAVDYNTNWPIARPLKEATATEIVKFIYEEIVMRFGCPIELVSDRGSNFMSKILNQYMKKIKAKHVFTQEQIRNVNG